MNPTIPSPQTIIHCDWSIRPGKRWSVAARLRENRYIISAPTPVPDDPLDLLRSDHPLFLGLDVPLGLPLAYAKLAGITTFVEFLERLAETEWATLFEPAAAPEEISVQRPFYPARPGGTRQAHLLEGLGLTDIHELRRRCEHATADRRAAAPLFWTMGAQQVGKAALSAWRELVLPAMSALSLDVALWPFSGALADTLGPHKIVMAEAYPAEFLTHFPLPSERYSKRRPTDRQIMGVALVRWAEEKGIGIEKKLRASINQGFGTEAASEDQFDAFVGVVGMLNVILGHRPVGDPPTGPLRQIEGWILGQRI